ncbi:hypothetical protein GLOTRDRAFT_137401 [Gloeophyllum trabeum ATCC 11539]|uniref:Uncharacterized protein n=1 Tax=Gloeophyllum trabeum (strain ATCC 11539 / FP-39264 / Madison 617) TaxID=670483 RepID=S7RUP3_GLOTA|nr:uncharacterized protein GLOTRDRAFT_137401 [Gloeophyllum trabeum ATCC 11539]EPQ56924.1 hypothetical protein GLOTRDRAFT_137401 [Gloeophyllum trabeum ATCC 11539]
MSKRPSSPDETARKSPRISPVPLDPSAGMEPDPFFQAVSDAVQLLQDTDDSAWARALQAPSRALAGFYEVLEAAFEGLLPHSVSADVDYFAVAQDEDVRRLVRGSVDANSLEALRAKLRGMSLPRRSPPDPEKAQKTSVINVGDVPYGQSGVEQAIATIRSWNRPFQGETARVLRETLSSFLDPGRDTYARYSTLVNASGTGKSRIVDELGKQVVVVQMCVRERGTTGFPPHDRDLMFWLTGKVSCNDGRAEGFLYALLTVTAERLKIVEKHCGLADLRSEARVNQLASAFRECMTEGQTFDAANKYRREFYGDVIAVAEKFADTRDYGKTVPSSQPRQLPNISKAAEKLMKVVFGGSTPELQQDFTGPAVIFSFDEAHVLTHTQYHQRTGGKWSVFSELTRVLRALEGYPIFSLFLSTTPGTFEEHELLPRVHRFAWNVPEKRQILPSITEVVFDDLAIRAREGEYTLERVTRDDFMGHLGRPLFGSRYDAGNQYVRQDLLDFAALKLVHSNVWGYQPLADDGLLACLAIRFAFEFRAKGPYEQQIEREQVECHMRICLAATPGFQTMVTVASSEPLLAEAAAIQLGRRVYFEQMARNLDAWGVHRGDRGELAAMLLLMKARDNVVYWGKPRVFSVVDFFGALLPSSAHQKLKDALPSVSREGECKAFSETFKDARMAFNHFIKVQEYEVVNVHYLWALVVRGAAIICPDHQRNVEIVIPFLFHDTTIQATNVSAVLITVKNDHAFGTEVWEHHFACMDPFDFELFSEDEAPLPVIRMAFCLGSRRSGITIVAPSPENDGSPEPPSQYTAYDIWCAGLSPETFPAIEKDDVKLWKDVARPPLGVLEALEMRDDRYMTSEVRQARSDMRRRMMPGAMALGPHFSAFIKLPQEVSEDDFSDKEEV